MKEIIGKTKDGIAIYNHPEGHSHRPDLDSEVISMISIDGKTFVKETVTMNRVIGYDHLVETNENDKIIMFQRGNRKTLSRMALNRTAKKTDKVTVILCKCGAEDGELEGKYVLITLFEGEPGMPERENDPECVEFWRTHALVPTEEELKEINNR